ncbi:MAG TPA: hypothetical protein VJ063_08400 [Verrucomicrobiae bacterium]|nr:hypothetical protein [Verrucomicrobiae bacterium]
MVSSKICDILYIDDNNDDVYFFRRAFEKSAIPCAVHVVKTFPDAVLYLKGDVPYTDRARFPFPNLIVFDLALRIADALAFIHWMRSEPALARIQLICLSAIDDPRKMNQIRELAVTVIPKSALFDDLLSLIRTVLPI